VAVTTPIFTRLTVAQQLYVGIYSTKFHPTWSRNMESMYGNGFTVTDLIS